MENGILKQHTHNAEHQATETSVVWVRPRIYTYPLESNTYGKSLSANTEHTNSTPTKYGSATTSFGPS